MDQNDIQLVKAAQKGEAQAFGRLYDSYIEKIYRFVFYRVSHREIAEDLTSRTFIKALEKIKSFDPEKGTFSSWLYRIARNTVIDHYRTGKTEYGLEAVWNLASSQDPEKETESKIALEKVWAYISRLDNVQREIIVMRVWEGLSHKEISQVLGKSEASCKMAYSRAMASLRQEVPLAVLLAFLLAAR